MKLNRLFVSFAALSIAGCGNEAKEGVTVTDAGVVLVGDAAVAVTTVTTTKLVSDQPGAAHTDPNLINAWGLAFAPTGVAWVASNAAGRIQLYDATGAPNAAMPTVAVPVPPGGTPPSAPTGEVLNTDATLFHGDTFLIATEDGTIVGWKAADGATAVIEIDNSAGADHAVYKGITIAKPGSGVHLLATDFHNNRIDVFDPNFKLISTPGAFTDPALPAGFAPFNVETIGDKVFVTYALQNPEKHDDVAAVGNGFVDTYDLKGGSQTRLISNGALNSPWGMALAPADFGAASGMLLVGNFGDGLVHAYNPTNGQAAGTVTSNGAPLLIDGLWALVFGGGLPGEATNQLFFTAGPAMETHGVFGRIDVPRPPVVTH
jgi:uncharacterized protein (TIGR03118 family)